MLATLIRPLLKGIKYKTGILNKNGFAKTLTKYLIDTREIPDASALLSFLQRSDTPKELSYPRPTKNPDRRIKALYLNDVRQYCLAHNNETEASFYSLDFCSGTNVSSAVLQGANGTGKTTLFSALEYLYQGYSEIASSHGYKEGQIDSYFRSVGAVLNNIRIEAQLEKDEEIKKNRLQGFELPAAFCSECDYFEITRNWKDIDYYIANQLGYWEMLRVHKKLSVLNELIKLALAYQKITKDISDLSDEITRIPTSQDLELIEKSRTRANLKFLRGAIRKNFDTVRGYDYNKKIDDFLNDNEGKRLPKERLLEVQNTFEYIDNIWKKLLGDFLKYARPIFKGILTEHLFTSSESFRMDVEDGIFKFNLKIIGNGDEEIRSPIEYFNTFRLKLFCLAFKISLFCCAKNLHKINLPFVVDDIFDSSDFYHRSTIGSFISHMIEAHDRVMEVKGTVTHPLQLIFFTQDNVIAENVYRGMDEYIFEQAPESGMKIKFGRLYRPCDANLDDRDGIEDKTSENNHIVEVQIKGIKTKVIPIVDYFTEI